MPHLAQVRPPGIAAAGGALTVAGGRAAGRAGPGATSGGLDARPASPLRGATGARAGGSFATIGAGGGGGTTVGGGGGADPLGAGAAVVSSLGSGLGVGGGGGGADGAGDVGSAGGGAGTGAGAGAAGSTGGSGLAAAASATAASSEPVATSAPDALAGSEVRAPLHSRNALQDSQKVASSGFSWPQFVQTITPISSSSRRGWAIITDERAPNGAEPHATGDHFPVGGRCWSGWQAGAERPTILASGSVGAPG